MSESQVLTHKCPNCGGPLLFEPKNQKFHCEYCGSRFTEQEVSDFEAKQEAAKVTDSPISSVSNDETTDEKEKITDSDQRKLTKTLTKKLDYFSVHLVVQKSSLMRQLLQLGAIIVIIQLF